ncbi:hypothetical protein TRFO_24153 [Tritrichomonas foetus]|uniref:Protein kinase domain-containing protein n=1 Tax=Tritrichomonas foetus TaxID=1144522 RepID=A0A1J4KD66_9EUKA|nr:hypothetical protein TRFO_24153 [Tritrichomonas foetus]|eukprot:OHT07652.1 hypothetical protein TRFO_24153 [Tritrichomonas foetus]
MIEQEQIEQLERDYPEFVVSLDRFESLSSKLIANGGFSSIFLVTDSTTNQKVIQKETGQNNTAVFYHEVKSLILLKDVPFVIKMIGFSIHPTFNIFLEYCPESDVESHIIPKVEEEEEDLEYSDDEEDFPPEEKKPFIKLTQTQKNTIAYFTAVGMSYVSKSGIIHNDFKTSNIFLTHDMNIPKIGDFGSSRFPPDENSLNLNGTILWMAPECLNGQAYPESDVYGFGLLIYEMLFEKEPWAEISNKIALITRNVEQNIRPNYHKKYDDSNLQEFDSTVYQLVQLMKRCWAQDHKERPTFTEIANLFKEKKVAFPDANLEEFENKVKEYESVLLS